MCRYLTTNELIYDQMNTLYNIICMMVKRRNFLTPVFLLTMLEINLLMVTEQEFYY